MKKMMIAFLIITITALIAPSAYADNTTPLTHVTYDPSSKTTTVDAEAIVTGAVTNTITPVKAHGQGKLLCQEFTNNHYCQCDPNILHWSQKFSCNANAWETKQTKTGACAVSIPGYSCVLPPTCTGPGCTPACDLGASGFAFQYHPEGNYNANINNAGFNSVHYQMTQNIIKSNAYANFTVNLLNSNWWGDIVFSSISGIPQPNTDNDVIDVNHPNTGVPGGYPSGHFTIAMPGSSVPSIKVDWDSGYCGNGCGGEEDEISADLSPENACTGDCPLVTTSYSSSVSVDDAESHVKTLIQNWPTTYATTVPIQGWTNKVINPLNTANTGYLDLAVKDIKSKMSTNNSYIMNGVCSTYGSANTPCTDNSSAVAYTSATYGYYLITLTKSNTMNDSGQNTGQAPVWTLSVSQNMCWDSVNKKILLK